MKTYYSEEKIEDLLLDAWILLQRQEELLNDYYTPFIKSKLENNTKDYTNELKEENSLLKTSLENLQKLFDRLIKFLKDRMFNKKEKDKYYDMSYELYKRDIISNDDMLKIKDNYDKSDSKNHNNDLEL